MCVCVCVCEYTCIALVIDILCRWSHSDSGI